MLKSKEIFGGCFMCAGVSADGAIRSHQEDWSWQGGNQATVLIS